jgi:hypothetical protein
MIDQHIASGVGVTVAALLDTSRVFRVFVLDRD